MGVDTVRSFNGLVVTHCFHWSAQIIKGIELFSPRSFDTMNRFQVDFDLNDEEDNALLADHLEDVEHGFDFLLTPHLDRRVRRLGVRHRNYVGRLMQRGGGAPLPPDR